MTPHKRGDVIWIFYRFQQNPEELWFPAPNSHAGLTTPRIGVTDGWTPALIEGDFDPSTFNPARVRETGVLIRYTSDCWYSRSGQLLDSEHDPDMAVERIHPDQIRREEEGPPPAPQLSVLVVRWCGEKDCDPVHEGGGGWGRTGSNVSDPYMRILFEEHMWPMIGPTYEVITVFVRSSEDLRRVHASATTCLMRGKHKAAFYFLWPTHFQDSVECPGYVNWQTQCQLMAEFEACGVPTRFPHHSHLYRLLLSKDWMKHLCLMPDLQAPVTTAVPRALITTNKWNAADTAIKAMHNLQRIKSTFPAGEGVPPVNVCSLELDNIKGVAKLGYSWEAMDVRRFVGRHQLAEALQSLAMQRYALGDSVMVQDWCDFEIELRLFWIDTAPEWDQQANKPKHIEPKKILYTRFCRIDEEDKMRDFERIQREECVQTCFQNDSPALAEAEKIATQIGNRVLWWLQTETCEPIPVIRMDFMCHRSADGKATVSLGEITELGACFLGWEEGPKEVFSAVVRSCFRLHSDRPSFEGQKVQYVAQHVDPSAHHDDNDDDDED